MAELLIKYDLYKILELDRAWDCKQIRKTLIKNQGFWIKRQSACNDTEQLMYIEEVLQKIEEGVKNLCKEINRKRYDDALDKAYKNKSIVDEEEKKYKDILEKAKAYYKKGNIKLAAQFAKEAIEGKVNDPSAYDVLARCYLDSNNPKEALNIVDNGCNVFKDNINLAWLGARIATVGLNNYEEAQKRINVLLEKAPNKAIGYTEQVYMHLYKGDEQLAFDEINSYIEKHPDDNNYKQRVSHDICTYIKRACYVVDGDEMFIADKGHYQKSLELSKKALEIYDDKYTRRTVENAEYYGNKQWNSWNWENIKTISLYSIVFIVLGIILGAFTNIFHILTGVGVFGLIIDCLLIYYSFRPYWQIFKTYYVTGKMGFLETVVNKIGSFLANVYYKIFRLLINAAKLIVKGFFWLITGGPFRH